MSGTRGVRLLAMSQRPLSTLIRPCPLPLRERVAREAGRVRGRAGLSDKVFNPSSVNFADTFSRKGVQTGDKVDTCSGTWWTVLS